MTVCQLRVACQASVVIMSNSSVVVPVTKMQNLEAHTNNGMETLPINE